MFRAGFGRGDGQADERPVLIVLHQEHSTPGPHRPTSAGARGYRLDIRRPRFGDPLPDTMAAHAGAVIFGGPMSANDGDDFIKREIDWIGVPLREERPRHRHLPRRADDGAPSWPAGLSPSRGPGRSRLLSDRADAGGRAHVRAGPVSAPRLPMAPRRFRPAARARLCSRPGSISKCRPATSASAPSRSSFTPK